MLRDKSNERADLPRNERSHLCTEESAVFMGVTEQGVVILLHPRKRRENRRSCKMPDDGAIPRRVLHPQAPAGAGG